ncbi:MAG: hypothetical protein ACM3SW_06510 [Actinomycetota bacterium]
MMAFPQLVLVFLFCSQSGASSPDPAADPAAIIQRSVEANQRDWAAAPEFNYRQRQKSDDGTRSYEELMIEGSRYERLIAMNGHALSPEREAAEARKLQKVIADRKNESADDRRRRIAKYEAGRKRDHLLMEQLTKAFVFTSGGEQTLDGRRVYVLHATPRPGYKPPNRDTTVLTGMNGTLWIDTETYQWVKVEAHVVHPVSIAGFAARVEPGTRFELEKMPVAPGIWLPKHFAMQAHARVLFFFHHHDSEDDTYSDYVPVATRKPSGLTAAPEGQSSR